MSNFVRKITAKLVREIPILRTNVIRTIRDVSTFVGHSGAEIFAEPVERARETNFLAPIQHTPTRHRYAMATHSRHRYTMAHPRVHLDYQLYQIY